MFNFNSVLDEDGTLLLAIMTRYAKTSKESYLKAWQKWLEYKPEWAQAKAIHANIYIDNLKNQRISSTYRKGEVRSKNTIKKQVMILYSLYQQLIEAKNLDIQNPFLALFRDYKNIEVREVRPTKMMNYDDVQRLVYEPTKHGKTGIRDAAFFALLFGAALRRNEAIKLDLQNIKYKDKLIYVELTNTKNKDDINQALPKWAAIILNAYATQRTAEGARKPDPLFVGYSRWEQPDNKRMTASAMWYRLREWCKRLNLEHIGTHAGRATLITKLLDDGYSHRQIREVSRHKSVEMVEQYDKRRTNLSNSLGLKVDYSKKTKA